MPRAKALLAAAGLADGFQVTMDAINTSPVIDIAQAIQATFAEAGVQLEIRPGDDKQTLTKYRARNHDIYIGRWGPDYQDPHSNADTFASNPDNRDEARLTGKLAWRNAWDIRDDRQDRGRGARAGRGPAEADVRGAAAGAPGDLAVRDPVSGRRADRRAPPCRG